MLRQRVITAVALVAFLLAVMLGLPSFATIWLVTILILIGAWEWAAFIGKGGNGSRAAFTAVVGALLAGCLYLLGAAPETVQVVLTVAVG